MSTRYLKLEEVIAIYYDQIERYGGSHGIRDLNLLTSAVYRPQVSFGRKNLYPDIYAKASALMHSIMLNHPFVDGNNRTGITATIA